MDILSRKLGDQRRGSPEVAPSKEEQRSVGDALQAKPSSPVLPAQPQPPGFSTPQPAVQAPATKELEREIQHILSEDIADIYRQLPPERKTLVAQEGRVATSRIMDLLHETTVRLKELVKVLRAWLQKIPGLNRFFVEQEARIKARKILTLKR